MIRGSPVSRDTANTIIVAATSVRRANKNLRTRNWVKSTHSDQVASYTESCGRQPPTLGLPGFFRARPTRYEGPQARIHRRPRHPSAPPTVLPRAQGARRGCRPFADAIPRRDSTSSPSPCQSRSAPPPCIGQGRSARRPVSLTATPTGANVSPSPDVVGPTPAPRRQHDSIRTACACAQARENRRGLSEEDSL